MMNTPSRPTPAEPTEPGARPGASRFAGSFALAALVTLAACVSDPAEDLALGVTSAAIISAPTSMAGGFAERNVVLVGSTTRSDGSTVLEQESVLDFTGSIVGTASARTIRIIDAAGAQRFERRMLLTGRYGTAPVTLSLGMSGTATTSSASGSLYVLSGTTGTTPLLGQGTLAVLGGAGTWNLDALPLLADISATFSNRLGSEGSPLLHAGVERDAQGEPLRVVIAPLMKVHNEEVAPLTIDYVKVHADGVLVDTWQDDRFMAGNATVSVDTAAENVFLDGPAPVTMRFGVQLAGIGAVHWFERDVTTYISPDAPGGYAFPSDHDDLPSNTYWVGATSHAGGNQRYGYDLGARRWNGSAWAKLYPGEPQADPESWVVYGLPVRAMADGVMIACHRTDPNWPTTLSDQSTVLNGDGDPNNDVSSGGNHVKIRTGNVVILYAHMMFESERTCPDLNDPEATVVHAGDVLGLVGNTGTAAPHLHIHAENPSGRMLPLPLRHADIVRMSLASGNTIEQAPWVTLGGRNLPEAAVLIRPGVPRCNGLAATITGTEDDDLLIGTSGNDVIVGGEGMDVIDGAGGADVICGRGGEDELYGGNHDDHVDGGAGDDTIEGDAGGFSAFTGNDELLGGPGVDFINGENGDDLILGGDGDDVLEGELGHDEVDGGAGDDVVRGHNGNDVLAGGAGSADWCEGGDGTDSLAPSHGCENISSVP